MRLFKSEYPVKKHCNTPFNIHAEMRTLTHHAVHTHELHSREHIHAHTHTQSRVRTHLREYFHTHVYVNYIRVCVCV